MTTLDDLKALRATMIMPNGVSQFVDALLDYLDGREPKPVPFDEDLAAEVPGQVISA